MTTLKQDYITHLKTMQNHFYNKGQYKMVKQIQKDIDQLNKSK